MMMRGNNAQGAEVNNYDKTIIALTFIVILATSEPLRIL